MFAEAGAWFWTMVVASIAIVIGDYNGTLEPALNKYEEIICIRTTLPEDTTIDAPYYIPPISEPIDSSFILPDSLKRNNGE